jgi:hypothetical protein
MSQLNVGIDGGIAIGQFSDGKCNKLLERMPPLSLDYKQNDNLVRIRRWDVLFIRSGLIIAVAPKCATMRLFRRAMKCER